MSFAAFSSRARSVVGAGVVVVVVLAIGGAAQARSHAALQLTPVVSGLSAPIYVTATSADPGALYVVEQGGRIWRTVGGVVPSKPFLDIHSLVSTGGEQGLLSMAFSPTYASDGLVYVDYTDTKGDTRVVEYSTKGKSSKGKDKPKKGKAPKGKQILKVKQPFDNHNGGQLQFGPDGMLYVGMGDGGSGGDPNNNGQNPSTFLGKLVRASGPGWAWSIFGFGLRNPWRFSFDRSTGDLYIADVGQGSWEEVDYRPAGSPAANYGWSRYEGTHDYNTSITLNPASPIVGPVTEYDHSNGNCAVIGGYVYRGSAMQDMVGRYFYADLCSGTIWSLVISGGSATDVRVEPISLGGIESFGEDENGELYAVGGNTVYQLTE